MGSAIQVEASRELPPPRPRPELRWIAVGVFVSSSTLNYLDRNLLSALAPLVMVDLGINATGYGWIIAAFSIAYAASSPLVGWFLDKAGVNRGISAALGWWSLASIASAFTRGLPGFVLCRVGLGIGESAGVPAVGKLNGVYLKPQERALGAAVNQIGLSLGLIILPLWVGFAHTHGWRAPFAITGALGLLWIPIWLLVSRAIRPAYAHHDPTVTIPRGTTNWAILIDRRMLILIAANSLWMVGYSTWSNWTTIYLTKALHLTLAETARYIAIPPLLSNLGGFFGGWLSLRWMRRSEGAITSRRRAIYISAVGSLLTLSLLATSAPAWTIAIISMSYFFALAGSVNMYALPIDIFGAERSGTAISALVFSFGIMQAVLSPLIGYCSDHRLYYLVITLTAFTPFLGASILWLLREPKTIS